MWTQNENTKDRNMKKSEETFSLLTCIGVTLWFVLVVPKSTNEEMKRGNETMLKQERHIILSSTEIKYMVMEDN